MGKPKLKKSYLNLRQLDGSFIKMLGCFEGTFETNNHFEIIPITVVKYRKSHALMGIDVFKLIQQN